MSRNISTSTSTSASTTSTTSTASTTTTSTSTSTTNTHNSTSAYYIHIINVIEFLLKYKEYKPHLFDNEVHGNHFDGIENKRENIKGDEGDESDCIQFHVRSNVSNNIKDTYKCSKFYKFGLSLAAYNNIFLKSCGININCINRITVMQEHSNQQNQLNQLNKIFQVKFVLSKQLQTLQKEAKAKTQDEIQKQYGEDNWLTAFLCLTKSHSESESFIIITKLLQLLSQNIVNKIDQINELVTKSKIKTILSKLLELFTSYDKKIHDEIQVVMSDIFREIKGQEMLRSFITTLQTNQTTFNQHLVKCAGFFLGPTYKRPSIHAFALSKLFHFMHLTPYACLVECNFHLTNNINDDVKNYLGNVKGAVEVSNSVKGDVKDSKAPKDSKTLNTSKTSKASKIVEVAAVEEFKQITSIMANVISFWEYDCVQNKPMSKPISFSLKEVEEIASVLSLHDETVKTRKIQRCVVSYIKEQVHLRKSSLHRMSYYLIRQAITCKYVDEWCS